MEEKPKQWWQGFTLRYLLFETALWAAVCAMSFASRYGLRAYIGYEAGLVVAFTLIGAAVGGLIRRPGVGAFVGAGIAAYLLFVNAMQPDT